MVNRTKLFGKHKSLVYYNGYLFIYSSLSHSYFHLTLHKQGAGLSYMEPKLKPFGKQEKEGHYENMCYCCLRNEKSTEKESY